MKQQIHFQSILLKGPDSGKRLQFAVTLSSPVLWRTTFSFGLAVCIYLN